jgi:protein ImuA
VKPALAELLRHPALWRGGSGACGGRASRSGVRELDDWLPGGGWPGGSLTELVCDHHGVGELSVLLPLLVRIGGGGRRVVFVAPPFVPYPPALAARGLALDTLLVVAVEDVPSRFWAAEQALRSGACGAVVLWLPVAGSTANGHGDRRLRRLQLAAERGDACGFVFRRNPAARHASSAALRLRLSPLRPSSAAGGSGDMPRRLSLTMLKCRGRAPGVPLVLALR